MIATAENKGTSVISLGNGVRSVATHVMECSNLFIFPQYQKDGDSSDYEGFIVAGPGESCTMRHVQPCLLLLARFYQYLGYYYRYLVLSVLFDTYVTENRTRLEIPSAFPSPPRLRKIRLLGDNTG